MNIRHQSLLAWIFWTNSDRLNFLMTMDYSPWVGKGNLAVFEGSSISEIQRSHPICPPKLVYSHAFGRFWHQPERPHPPKYLHAWIFWADSDRLNFLMTMDYSPWVEREIWSFLKVAVSPKPKRPHPPKLVWHECWYQSPTCMNFLTHYSDRLNFLMTMDYIVHGSKGKFGRFWR